MSGTTRIETRQSVVELPFASAVSSVLQFPVVLGRLGSSDLYSTISKGLGPSISDSEGGFGFLFSCQAWTGLELRGLGVSDSISVAHMYDSHRQAHLIDANAQKSCMIDDRIKIIATSPFVVLISK